MYLSVDAFIVMPGRFLIFFMQKTYSHFPSLYYLSTYSVFHVPYTIYLIFLFVTLENAMFLLIFRVTNQMKVFEQFIKYIFVLKTHLYQVASSGIYLGKFLGGMWGKPSLRVRRQCEKQKTIMIVSSGCRDRVTVIFTCKMVVFVIFVHFQGNIILTVIVSN